MSAGVHGLIPFVDAVRRYNNRVRFYPIPTFNPSTRDGKTLTVGGTICFSITDPLTVSVRLVDFAMMRTLRLLQESWRLYTDRDKHPD